MPFVAPATLNSQVRGHELTTESLTPAKAVCSCGGWVYSAAFSKSTTDFQIQQQIAKWFGEHSKVMKRRGE